MNKVILIVGCAILLFIISISGCMDTEHTATELLDVNYSVDNLADSRQKEVTIYVKNQKNESLSNAQVSYEQMSQDFMYSLEGSWEQVKKLGVNTQSTYLESMWGLLEPEDDVYNWTLLETTGGIDKQGNLKANAEHIRIRLGIGTGDHPSWLNDSDIEQIKTKYLEFLESLISHLKFSPDFYSMEIEINSGGLDDFGTNQGSIDWCEQFANKLRELDSSAKIGLSIVASDLMPEPAVDPPNDDDLISAIIFLERADYIDYDIISVWFQYLGWYLRGDWEDSKEFIESLNKFDKDIYIENIGFIAEEPVIPEDVTPNPNSILGLGIGFFYYPPPEGYSEEWQKNNTINFMNYAISNPQIIGTKWDFYDYIQPMEDNFGNTKYIRAAAGFTSSYQDIESGEYIQGNNRSVLEPMKELWFNLFSNGTLNTNEDGTVDFICYPGEYRIIVSHPSFKAKEMIIDV